MPLLAPGVAQQIVAQPDDVLLHDGELVTQAAGLDQCPTEIVLEQAPAGRGQAHPHLPLVGGIAWLKYLSPFYYYAGHDPLRRGIDAVDLVVLGALALVLTALGTAAFERRDLRG